VGAELEPIKDGELTEAFVRLGRREITSVLLEGGAVLHTAAWKAGLVDAVHLYVVPVTLGSEGVSWLDVETVSPSSLADHRVTPLGRDMFIEGYVHGID
jgi:diaminohydroxyphosphoribosylaminopyrimidine deaminase/5-amino-6-(5-phosphoribosylamino)uracil reductase